MSKTPKPLTSKRRTSPASPGSTVLIESPTTSSGVRNRRSKIKGVDSKPNPQRTISHVKDSRAVPQNVKPGKVADMKDCKEPDEDNVDQVRGDEKYVLTIVMRYDGVTLLCTRICSGNSSSSTNSPHSHWDVSPHNLGITILILIIIMTKFIMQGAETLVLLKYICFGIALINK